MKRVSSVVVACACAASLALSLAGCFALDNGTVKVLKPSAVSSKLKDLDDDDNPFAKKATRVDYLVVDIKSYDSFFKDSAELKGTVVLADVILKETDVYIAKVKRAGGKDALSDKQLKEFDQKKNRLGVISDLLGDVPDRAGKLAKTGSSLTTAAPKTFVGPNAAKLPGVYKGLEQSTDDIKSAGQQAPKLLTHAQKTTASLVGL